ncbi:MAG: hypothetical protein WBP26_01930 [Candidatus Saccharimonadales bacterium]
MDLDTASQLLLIIVSTVLSVFLIVGIILIVKLIKISKGVNHIVVKAEGLVDSAEAAASVLRKGAGTLAFSRIISNIADLTKNSKK